MLGKGADINLVLRTESGMMSPLLIAAFPSVTADTFKLLLDKGADPNLQMPDYGITALHTLFNFMYCDEECQDFHTQFENFEILLQHNVDVNIQSYNKGTCIHEMAFNKVNRDENSEIVDKMLKLLKDRGADLNARTLTGNTALHLACADGIVNAVDSLVNNEADTNVINHLTGDTPLHELVTCTLSDKFDVEADCIRLIEMLITEGANINSKTFSG